MRPGGLEGREPRGDLLGRRGIGVELIRVGVDADMALEQPRAQRIGDLDGRECCRAISWVDQPTGIAG